MSEPPAPEPLGESSADRSAAAPKREPLPPAPPPTAIGPVNDSSAVASVAEPLGVLVTGKVRSPAGGWLLAWVTLGIYYLFWYHHMNKELRDVHPSIRVSPGIAVLCLFVPIVNLVSIYNTGGRIRQAQAAAGATPAASGWIGVVLTFVIGLDLPYYNAQANQAWRAVGVR